MGKAARWLAYSELFCHVLSLNASTPCIRCPAHCAGGSVPRLYLFPTGNAFHGSCLCAEVCALAPPQQQARIQRLLERLAKVRAGRGGLAGWLAGSLWSGAGVPSWPPPPLRLAAKQRFAHKHGCCL